MTSLTHWQVLRSLPLVMLLALLVLLISHLSYSVLGFCTLDHVSAFRLDPPRGRSGDLFKERGMRNDQHDAVAATFWIPYDVVPDAEPPRSPSEPRMLIVIGCSSTLMPVLGPI